MSSFSFNFLDPATTPEHNDNNNNNNDKNKRKPFVWVNNLEHLWQQRSHQEIIYTEISVPGLEDPLKRVCSCFKNQPSPEKETNVQPYQAGTTVWEGSLDLLQYLVHEKMSVEPNWAILELGCGHALPSCWLLRQALQQVDKFLMVLVDFHEHVIYQATLSNLVLNTAGQENDSSRHVRLGHGDWLAMSRQLLLDDSTLPARFDLILAAETVYSEQTSRDTALLLSKHLQPDTGVGLIATKRYYFGIGGGSDCFRRAIQQINTLQKSQQLQVETVRVYNDGCSNIREILKVTRVVQSEESTAVENKKLAS